MIFYHRICPRHPRCGKSSNGWQLTNSTGIPPLRGSLVAALIACDGIEFFEFTGRTPSVLPVQSLISFRSDLRLDRSIIIPFCLLSLYWSHPIFITEDFSLSTKVSFIFKCDSKLTMGGHGAIVNVAFAFDKNKRNVLDE